MTESIIFIFKTSIRDKELVLTNRKWEEESEIPIESNRSTKSFILTGDDVKLIGESRF